MKAPLLQSLLSLNLILCWAATTQEQECSSEVDYLIVGAGGSGIQTALLLQNYGYSFQILEREQTAASFWTKFPVFQELISVNKKVQNESQRYRYDWHSFLSSNVSMWDVSTDYFPSGKDWHRYMNRVVDETYLNIEYGTEVQSLDTDGKPCVFLMDGSKRCAKHRVFVGTGLKERDERYLRAIGGVRYSDMTKEIAIGRRVCIIGNGNAGFEVAQNVFGVADRVIVSGRHPARVSAVTKYTGDVRVKFLTPLENFHGKLLDTVVHVDLPFQWTMGLDSSLNRTQSEELTKVISAAAYANLHQCEVLVLATGFRSQVPGQNLKGRRFPTTGDWYTAKDNPNIHFVGWLMHQRDFRRGAGGFLSGYRYLIQNLIHHVREEDHTIPYPHHTFTKQQALEHAVNRFQIASELVILQDGLVMRDAMVPVKTEEGEKKEYHYYEGVTYKFHDDFNQQDDIIYLYFAWGDGRSAASVFDNVYLYNDTQKLRNIYLHPVVEVNGLVREAEEDLDMEWVTVQFIPPIKRIVRDAILNDLSKFYPRPIYTYERQEYSQPKDKHPYEKGKHPGLNIGELRERATEAIILGGTREALRKLRAEARMVIPSLISPPKRLPPGSSEKNESSLDECTPGGETCGFEDSSAPCCVGASCIYVSDLDASFCIAVGPNS